MIRFQAFEEKGPWFESVAFAAGGREVAAVLQSSQAGRGAVWWDWAAGRAVHRVDGPDVGLSPDGEYVAVHDRGKAGAKIRVYRDRGREPVATVPWPWDGQYTWAAPAVAPGGAEMVVVSPANVSFVRLPDGREVARKPWGSAFAPRYSPGGRWAYAEATRAVKVWDRAGKYKPALVPAATRPKAAVAGDDRTAAVTRRGDKEVAVVDLATRAEVRVLAHEAMVFAVALAPDGGRVLTADLDGIVRVWDARTGAEAGRFDFGLELVTALAVSPDGLLAAAGGGGQLVVWDLGG